MSALSLALGRKRTAFAAGVGTHLVLALGAVGMLLPLLWVVSASLRPEGTALQVADIAPPRPEQGWAGALLANTKAFLSALAPRENLRVRIEGRPRPLVNIEGQEGEQFALLRETPAGSLVAKVAGARPIGSPFLVDSRKLEPIRRVRFHWKNYADAWHAVRLEDFRLFGWLKVTDAFLMYFLNSLFVALMITAGQVATSSFAGYAFARLRFPGRDALFLAYLATMMVPFMVMVIPVFILFQQLRLVDTYAALILPGIFSAYGTFMLRQFFLSIPRELEDAGRIDGCGPFAVYWRIILPLSKPALATLTTFTFLHSWNDFLWPLLMVNSEHLKTVPLGLRTFEGLYAATEWSKLMAASLIFTLPVVVLFLYNQRFFIRGILLSGLKG